MFSTQSRNDTRQTGARVVQVVTVPEEKSALDAPACVPGNEEARPGPGRCLMMICPRWVKAQLRRRLEVPWVLKRWGQRHHQGVPRGRRVRRLSVELKWMVSQAYARGRLMLNLASFIVRRASWFLGVKTQSLTWWARYWTVGRESCGLVRQPYALFKSVSGGRRGSSLL